MGSRRERSNSRSSPQPRTGEVIGATNQEIDKKSKIWIVPAERMKAGKEHRVPLSDRALAILDKINRANSGKEDFVFPGGNAGKPLSNMAMLKVLVRTERGGLTVHGFRSTFRDWAAERTNFPNEVVEMALAYAADDKTKAAYRRGDILEKRRQLMDVWSEYCRRAAATDGVISLRSV
jgi:integrase